MASRMSVAFFLSSRLWIAAPVGVGALHRDFAPDDLGLEQALELRLQIGADAHRDVIEVDEQRGVGGVGGRFFVDGARQMIVLLGCHFSLGSRLTTVARGASLPTKGNATTPVDRIGLLLVAKLAVVGAGRVLGRVAGLIAARPCALPRPIAEARRRRLIIRPLAYSSARCMNH